MTMSDDFVPPAPVPAASNGAALPVSALQVPSRIREIDAAWVEALAASMEERGLDTPITVRPVEGDGPTSYILVAGAHRLAAAKLLGWPSIKCVVRYLDDDEARLVEIDENLLRRELHVLDKAIFLTERKRLYEARFPATQHGKNPKGGESQTLRLSVLPPRFTADAASKTGFSERAIQLAVQLATNLDDEAIRNIRGLPIADNQAALISLSKEPPAKQRTLTAAMRDGGARTVAQARVAAGFEDAPSGDPQPVYLAQLHTAWAKADIATRQLFLDDIDAAYLTVPKPRAEAREFDPEVEIARVTAESSRKKPRKGVR